jgi:hypothetical protein
MDLSRKGGGILHQRVYADEESAAGVDADHHRRDKTERVLPEPCLGAFGWARADSESEGQVGRCRRSRRCKKGRIAERGHPAARRAYIRDSQWGSGWVGDVKLFPPSEPNGVANEPLEKGSCLRSDWPAGDRHR